MTMHTNDAAHATFFMGNEPLAGTRMVDVTESKTKMEWAIFIEKIAARYENTEKIT